MVLDKPGASKNVGPGLLQVDRLDLGEPDRQRTFELRLGHDEITSRDRGRFELARRELHPLILDQASRQFGPRILGLLAGVRPAHGQQHSRLDVDEHRRHQEVLAGEFEVSSPDLLDVGQILPRHVGHRNVEDVEVLAPDQVEKQVERALEGLENDLERIGRDVEVARDLEHRLAIQPGDHLQLELLALDATNRRLGPVERHGGSDHHRYA